MHGDGVRQPTALLLRLGARPVLGTSPVDGRRDLDLGGLPRHRLPRPRRPEGALPRHERVSTPRRGTSTRSRDARRGGTSSRRPTPSPSSALRMPSWMAQLRPRIVRSNPCRRNGVDPSSARWRRPPGWNSPSMLSPSAHGRGGSRSRAARRGAPSDRRAAPRGTDPFRTAGRSRPWRPARGRGARARAGPGPGRAPPPRPAAPRRDSASASRRASPGRRRPGRSRTAARRGSVICTKESSGTPNGPTSTSTRTRGSRSSRDARSSTRAQLCSGGAKIRRRRCPAPLSPVAGSTPKRAHTSAGISRPYRPSRSGAGSPFSSWREPSSRAATRASVNPPPRPRPARRSDDAARAAPVGCRSQSARARARSSGVLRFMNATSGSAKGATAAAGTRTTRTIVEQADDLELACPETSLHRREARLPVDGVERLRAPGRPRG